MSAEDVTQQRLFAEWVASGSYVSYKQLLVRGMSFVAWPQRNSMERGWAVLNWEPGDVGMRFAHILDVVEHPQSQADALADGECPVRLLVKCELFDSIAPAAASGEGSTSMQQQQQQALPMLDEDGLLVMSTKPLELCPGVTVHICCRLSSSVLSVCVLCHTCCGRTCGLC
jgi:hypothetical protein